MILRSLPGPFFAALGTLVFLLLLQFLMSHLKNLVGRGLPPGVIVELISYSLAYMLSLAVPMALLLATLVVFGRLADSQAYAVCKSTGISLLGLTWPVLIVGMAFVACMSHFNAVMLPEANHRMRALWQDIRVAKPGFELEPGVFFSGLEGYTIRVEDAPPESNELFGVLIFDHSASGAEATIVAERGELVALGAELVEMTLFDGEIHRTTFVREPRGRVERYERIAFERHRLTIDVSHLVFERRGADATARTSRTMRAAQLAAQVDSIRADNTRRQEELRRRVDRLLSEPPADEGPPRSEADTLLADPPPARSPLLAGLPPAEQRAITVMALQRARTIQAEIDATVSTMSWQQLRGDRYLVEYYKMYSMALASFVFVLFGIPLGLMVRRRGYGWAVALAAGVFLFYWMTLVQGEKLADRAVIAPWVGIWTANIVGGIAAMVLFIRETRLPAGLRFFERQAAPRRDAPRP